MEDRQEWTVMVTAEEKLALSRLLREMRAGAEADAPDSRPGEHFLTSRSQMRIYKVHVRAYYFKYIAGREVSHKLRMLHFAAIYQVIVSLTGMRDGKFWGPEYDRFLVDCCQLRYNESDTRKGRYRQVGDVYKRYAHGVTNRDNTIPAQGEEKLQGLYNSFVANFKRMIMADSHGVAYRHARVPEKLDDTNS